MMRLAGESLRAGRVRADAILRSSESSRDEHWQMNAVFEGGLGWTRLLDRHWTSHGNSFVSASTEEASPCSPPVDA